MKRKQVFNKSKLIFESANMETCPRCSGFGATTQDSYDGVICPICNGYGVAWKTGSGWTLPKYGRENDSKLY